MYSFIFDFLNQTGTQVAKGMLEFNQPTRPKQPAQNQRGKEVMTREKFSRNKGKSPKFKESYDEDYDWEDQKEDQKRRKKMNKKPKRPADTRDKW